MTEEVKLALSGNYQKTVRIFSLRGAHLIAMFARTSLAKQFRKWVLDVLDSETKTQTIIPISNSAQIPKANRPIIYRTEWKPATITLFGKTAHYIYFESTHIDDLWVQVVEFAARCNSGCSFV